MFDNFMSSLVTLETVYFVFVYVEILIVKHSQLYLCYTEKYCLVLV